MNPDSRFLILFTVGYVYLAASGCSGAAKNVKAAASSIPIEAPLTAYGSGPMDTFGRLTNWPKEPAFQTLDLSKLSGKLPLPGPDTTTSYYQLIGRLISGRLMIDGHKIMPAALLDMKEWQGKSRYDCSGRPRGEAIMPGNTPVELVFWKALDDMFRNSPLLTKAMNKKKASGKVYADLQAQKKSYRGRQLGEWVETTREVMVFRVTPHLKCRSQKKTFKLVAQDIDPATKAQDSFQWNRAGTLGLNGHDRGEVSAELTGTAGESIVYTLRFHIGMDVDALYGNGETYDWTLQCRSDTPIFASQIKGLCFGLQTWDNNTWKGVICGYSHRQ